MMQPSEDADTEARPLAEAIIALAETPDDDPGIDVQLKSLVQLAADRVSAADYASVTVLRNDAYSTVAASSAIAAAHKISVEAAFNLMRRHARSHNQKLSTLAHTVVRDPGILREPTN